MIEPDELSLIVTLSSFSLTVCLVLYFILGFLWKRFKQEKQGFDAVPNFLWKDLPGLVADGFRFLVSKTCGRSASNEGYSQM
jgi:hypothetical protein